jgi:uncharacterized protein
MAFALLFPTLAAWVYFIALPGESLRIAYGVSKAIQFLFPVLWVLLYERRPPQFGRPRAAGLGWGLTSGLTVLAATLLLYYGYFRGSPVLAGAPRAVAEHMVGFGIATTAEFVALAVFLSVIHSLAEEYYWRWFVFGQLRSLVPPAAAVVISSLGFMGHHVIVVAGFLGGYGVFTWFFSLCVAVGGAMWAVLYQRTQSLFGPWLSHFLVDVGLMWVGYDLWRAASQ